MTVGLTVGVGLGVHLGLAGARLLAAKYTEYSAHCQTVGDSSDTVGSDIIELSRGRMWLIAGDLKKKGKYLCSCDLTQICRPAESKLN